MCVNTYPQRGGGGELSEDVSNVVVAEDVLPQLAIAAGGGGVKARVRQQSLEPHG